MTDKKLENLFLALANTAEAEQAKANIKDILTRPRVAKYALGLLLPAVAVVVVFIVLHLRSAPQKITRPQSARQVSVYDSPMYVYLINAVYQGE
jgi:hypothetical protein